MSRNHGSMFEALESRTLLSAATLAQDQLALQAAITQYKQDIVTSKSVLAGDRAKVKQDGKVHDPALAPLRNKLKQDELARKNTLLADRTALKIAINNDDIAILKDRANIRTDKLNKNDAQLALDKAQLSKDQLQRTTDHTTLGTLLQNDIISTQAIITADKLAIVNEIRTNGGNPALASDKQTLINDEQTWRDKLASDRKIVLADRLIVAQDKHA